MFNWTDMKERAVQHKIRRTISMAKGKNPDLMDKHPDWVREASEKNYKNIEKQVKDKVTLQQKIAIERRQKYGKLRQ